jgi:hypothetical protein
MKSATTPPADERALVRGEAQSPQVLFVYDQMLRNVCVVYGGYSVDLPEDWAEKASSLNHVYLNGLANVYVG